MWDGKWGIEKDGTDTPHKDSYADPKQYVMEANLYLDGTEDSPLLFTKKYDLYVLRLGIEQIAFVNDANLQYPFRYVADWTTNTPGLSTAGEQHPINDPVWRIGAHDVAATGLTNLDVTEAGPDYGIRRDEEDPWGEDSTTSDVQAEIDEIYWPPSEQGAATTVEDDTYNLPVCYVYTSDVRLDVVIGQRAASQVLSRVLDPAELGYRNPCEYEVNIDEVTSNFVDVAGDVTFTAIGGSSLDDIGPGDTINLEADRRLAQTVGKEKIEVSFAFSYTDDGEEVLIPGYQTTSHVVYRVAATPQAPQATPWVCVLDYAALWASGSASSPAAQTASERALYEAAGWSGGQEMRIQYDLVYGRANYAHGAVNVRLANFTMYLHRTRSADPGVLVSEWMGFGAMTANTVNCLDCAALLPCFANAIGGNLRTSILAPPGFPPPPPPLPPPPPIVLNPICPLGWDKWLAIQLLPTGEFSYHAVATEGIAALGDGTHVYDSCLKLGTPDPTVFVLGADAQPADTRFSNGSVFDAPNSLTLGAAAGPGGGKGTLNGRPSNTPNQPDTGPDSELNGINATYTVTMDGPLGYDVDRQWVAPAGTNHSSPQGRGLPVRVPPALPGAPTDCTTTDRCVGFEIVEGAVPFVLNETFTFTSTFNYDGEYQEAFAAPGPEGRGRCQWNAGPHTPALE